MMNRTLKLVLLLGCSSQRISAFHATDEWDRLLFSLCHGVYGSDHDGASVAVQTGSVVTPQGDLSGYKKPQYTHGTSTPSQLRAL